MPGANRNLVHAGAVQHLLDLLRPADVSLHEELVVDVWCLVFNSSTITRLSVSVSPSLQAFAS
jgi:hypothetical protein